ncbi:hypothetical protein AALO_G00023510, partial [Alosa alosa]
SQLLAVSTQLPSHPPPSYPAIQPPSTQFHSYPAIQHPSRPTVQPQAPAIQHPDTQPATQLPSCPATGTQPSSTPATQPSSTQPSSTLPKHIIKHNEMYLIFLCFLTDTYAYIMYNII